METKGNTRTLRRSRLMLGIVVAMAAPAFAQQAPQSSGDDKKSAESSEATTLDAVTVTGSRIRRAGFDTLEPASVVSREYIENRALTNVADAINEMPGFGAGVTPEGGQSTFGPGLNFVNRFGLGSNRTLTMVNGRRFVSSNAPTIFGPASAGLQVDLNVIPTQMIERVETLAIGGAPTYGSDAIAGVVNVILRKDFEGAEFGASYGVTERGDNHRYNAYALLGTGFDQGRGNVVFSLSYDNVDGVLQKERDFYAAAYLNTTNPNAATVARVQPGRTPANDGRYNADVPFNTGNTDGIPNGVLIRNRRIWSTPPGGYIYPVAGLTVPNTDNLVPRGFGAAGTTYLGFDTSGNLVPYAPGTLFSTTDASGGDGLNLVDQGQITSDLTRMSVFNTARWGLTDNVDVFFEGSFYSAEATELTDQSAYNSPLFGTTSGALRVTSTHPLLTDQARSVLAANGITSFNLSRASRDLVENNASSTSQVGRAVFGLEGSFDLADRMFYWEASYNYGRSLSRFFGTSLLQQNFINALNVSRNASGQIVCNAAARNVTYATTTQNSVPGSFAVADPNCVPLDLFGEGRASDAAKRYVTRKTTSEALLEQSVFNVNVSSTLFDLWSGPLQYNLGYEHRKESGLFDPDATLQATPALTRSVSVTPTKGRFSTDEYFAEVLIPLVNPDSDLVLRKKLDVTGKYRQVDNTINGKFDAYTYGLQWKPFGDLELRGNFTRSLRAPAIAELFTPTASIFTAVNDPCDTRNVTGGAKPATRQANCAAFYDHYDLNPQSFTSNAISATVQGTTGGDPNLKNESADSLTYGFTWAPSFLEGLTFAADYYKIEIEDIIVNLGQADIATGCFDNDDFNAADVPNANPFCSRIVRRPDGQITSIRTGFINGEYTNFEGYSAELQYRFRTDRFGSFNFGVTGYFPKELVASANGIVPDESVGEIGTSEKQYLFSGAWQGDKLGLTATASYLSSAQFDLLNTVESRDILRVDGYWLFNAGASYRISDDATVRLAVTNLTDEEPPFPTIGVGTYDLLGRRYNLAFEWKFN